MFLDWCRNNSIKCLIMAAVVIIIIILMNKKYGWFNNNTAEETQTERLDQRGYPEEGSVVSDAVQYDLKDRATDGQGQTIRDYEIEQGLLDGQFTGSTWGRPLYSPNQWLLQKPRTLQNPLIRRVPVGNSA